ncbi:MAG: hypothetical protein COV72_05685 [Candidatus Omnitrophica bacterium CG11_big_fil_rev_8_21_14_0_20_42_13]|uniref:TonB C-terminal domain-containing protein n=1 Tax=Candidatus Ghiorseimicrobium undicola TaxID=1974746 RepID=A0A2H0LZ47_9BACT|nr:MAG: hypothetical protein COV72_05685 [Candidatus Omnitrophica bacterium CG11_big_fil_rev_8_21_14_0_20_42_13]
MKKTLKRLVLILAIFFISLPLKVQSEQEEIALVIPEVKTISLSSPPKRIAITNPEIIDISSVSASELIINPKSVGKTSLVVWDSTDQKTTYPIRVLVEDLQEIKKRIDKLINELGYLNIYTKVSNEENKILLLGSVASQEHKDRLISVLGGGEEGSAVGGLIGKIIDMVEIKSQSQLVQIDVEILEVSKSALEDLGFKWTSALGDDGAASTGIQWTETSDNLSNDIYHLGQISRIWERGAISSKLNLIITQGYGRVLSRPKLVCLSGKEASFLVGGEIPVVTTSTVSGGVSVSVEYKEYGILLEISPTVKSDKFVQATLNTEISDIDKGNAVTASGIDIPAFSKRSAKTELYLKDNQTVFLAGLISNDDSKNIAKLPALADIPILGALFRSKKFEAGETELVISLTPKIIRQEEGNDKITNYNITGLDSSSPRTLTNYVRHIQEKIVRAIIYPDMAQKYNSQGEVSVSMHILADGRLLNVLINKSSGNSLLDETAVNIVKAQAPFPPIPATSGLGDMWIDVPIVFRNN